MNCVTKHDLKHLAAGLSFTRFIGFTLCLNANRCFLECHMLINMQTTLLGLLESEISASNVLLCFCF